MRFCVFLLISKQYGFSQFGVLDLISFMYWVAFVGVASFIFTDFGIGIIEKLEYVCLIMY